MNNTPGDALVQGGLVNGDLVDVRIRAGRIVEVGSSLASDGEPTVQARGGEILPGLHDHHIHLSAFAAANRSIAIDENVTTLAELADVLRTAPGSGWVRAVGYHESIAGLVDRHTVDQLLADRPVRIQHSSGAMWIVNTAALEQLSAVVSLDDAAVEKDDHGQPNGRLWRFDHQWRSALADDGHIHDLKNAAAVLLRHGITSVTDATAQLSSDDIAQFEHVAPIRVHSLGSHGFGSLPVNVSTGPRKIVLHDHELPTFDELLTMIDPHQQASHRHPVAVHCVTRESLILTIAALEILGSVPGDRIEHGAVVPHEMDPRLASLGMTVVTQPDFIRTRGDRYIAEVDDDDRGLLYRFSSLLQSGVAVVASSDAPYSSVNPWQIIQSAHRRTTRGGVRMAPEESVTPADALRGYLSRPDAPEGPERRIQPGERADLIVLTCALSTAFADANVSPVRHTMIDGNIVY